MTPESTDWIPAWFAAHDGDGEFALSILEEPHVVSRPTPAAPCIYTTKVSQLGSILPGNCTVGIVGQVGLPSDSDVAWLKQFGAGREWLFLGDLDPVDLAIFAWLRGQMTIRYLGVSDAFLRAAKLTVTPNMCSQQAVREQLCWEKLQPSLPDLTDLVGPTCAQRVRDGKRLELEAICSFATRADLLAALVL